MASGRASPPCRRCSPSAGAIIIDGDAVVRELQQPGSPVVEAIAARFEGVVGA
ncbi:MAG: hypothetical protein WKF58_00575 [Ilumatobacteraceae bacterium]